MVNCDQLIIQLILGFEFGDQQTLNYTIIFNLFAFFTFHLWLHSFVVFSVAFGRLRQVQILIRDTHFVECQQFYSPFVSLPFSVSQSCYYQNQRQRNNVAISSLLKSLSSDQFFSLELFTRQFNRFYLPLLVLDVIHGYILDYSLFPIVFQLQYLRFVDL
jgi:hypothetical protein